MAAKSRVTYHAGQSAKIRALVPYAGFIHDMHIICAVADAPFTRMCDKYANSSVSLFQQLAALASWYRSHETLMLCTFMSSIEHMFRLYAAFRARVSVDEHAPTESC